MQTPVSHLEVSTPGRGAGGGDAAALRGVGLLRGVGSVRGVLGQLADLLGGIGVEDYVRRPGATFGGSIGGHVRHCLDHVAALLDGLDGSVIDYEKRERGTAVEADPGAAAARVAELGRRLGAFAGVTGLTDDTAVRVVVLVAAGEEAVVVPSSVGRELAFVLSHTIHHHAMIGGMVQAMGGAVPEGFGVAPGTLRYRRERAGPGG